MHKVTQRSDLNTKIGYKLGQLCIRIFEGPK